MNHRQNLPLLFLLLASTAGCFKKPVITPPTPPRKLAVKAEAMPQLNLDPQGESMSVVVRVYQLKDKGDFQKLTLDLIGSGRPDSELFPQDFLTQKELILVPGAIASEVLDLHADAKFVGLVGHFRKPDMHAWRHLVPVEQMVAKALSAIPAAAKLPQPPILPLLTFKAEQCFLEVQHLKAEPLAGQPAVLKPVCQSTVVAPEPEPAPRVAPKPALKNTGRAPQRIRQL